MGCRSDQAGSPKVIGVGYLPLADPVGFPPVQRGRQQLEVRDFVPDLGCQAVGHDVVHFRQFSLVWPERDHGGSSTTQAAEVVRRQQAKPGGNVVVSLQRGFHQHPVTTIGPAPSDAEMDHIGDVMAFQMRPMHPVHEFVERAIGTTGRQRTQRLGATPMRQLPSPRPRRPAPERYADQSEQEHEHESSLPTPPAAGPLRSHPNHPSESQPNP